MDNLIVTCPETGHTEEIDGYVARDGELLVVLRCSRFDPPEAVSCSMLCTQCATHRELRPSASVRRRVLDEAIVAR